MLYYFMLYSACKNKITSLYITGEIKIDLAFFNTFDSYRILS